MSVDALHWKLSSKLLLHLRGRFDGPGPLRVLSLGYTDYMISRENVAEAWGEEAAAKVADRKDVEGVAAYYGTAAHAVETASLYRAIGFETDFLDVAEVRGGELIQDLNEPLSANLTGAYDLVLDFGTLEHCFNIAQAIKNVAMALRVGGIACHGNPMVMINHGFYNFSPQFYYEFYIANGFALLDMFGVAIEPTKLTIERFDAIGRYRLPSNHDRTIHIVAQKTADVALQWPTQTKYRTNPAQTRQRS